MTWIRHDFERSMSKHLTEKEVKLKVDNSGYVRMLNWFKKNTDLLEPHNSGTVSPDSGVKHADKTKALQKAGLDTSFPYGYCYPISQFVFYTLGGYESISAPSHRNAITPGWPAQAAGFVVQRPTLQLAHT